MADPMIRMTASHARVFNCREEIDNADINYFDEDYAEDNLSDGITEEDDDDDDLDDDGVQ